jgi:hypothetical protein
MTERSDEPMQPVSCWASLVAEMGSVACCGDPLHHPSHALFGSANLANETHFSTALAISHRDGVPRLHYINPNKNLATMLHGSSSCGEDRLGHSEQPSKAQCRANHLDSADIRSYEE